MKSPEMGLIKSKEEREERQRSKKICVQMFCIYMYMYIPGLSAEPFTVTTLITMS